MTNEKHCYHCGAPVLTEKVYYDDKLFCCKGCESVYRIFEENDLGDFYALNDAPGVKPKENQATKYAYLDEPNIAQRFVLFDEDGKQTVRLFLPSIHCSSCIWILENLHKLNKFIYTSEVNFVSKKALITFNSEQLKLSELAVLLGRIGYQPVFDIEAEQKKDYNLLIKLAVAGFCFGNVMLLSFPEYLNMDETFINEFRNFFASLIFIFSLPVIFYSASDYLVSAYKAVRSKQVNLDVPISLGILALYGKSVYDIFTGSGPGYMDSFTGFVFFLLIGKWFQSQTYKALSFERNYKSYFPLSVSVLDGDKEKIKPLEELKIGDEFLVRNEEIIPADAILLSDTSSIDYSFVTGESDIVHKFKNDKIFAGGKYFGETIRLKSIRDVNQSYLTSLWNKDAFTKHNKTTSLATKTNNISRYFIWAVLILSSVTALIWSFIDYTQIVNVLVSVLIVACPCALALSIPFTYGNTMQKMGRNKLYLKNTDVVENLAHVTDVVFDKTGTITHTNSKVERYEGKKLNKEEISIIVSLAYQSTHPLSKSIYSYLADSNINRVELSNFVTYTGKGIEAKVSNETYRLGSSSFVSAKTDSQINQTSVFLSKNGEVLGTFFFENKYREGLSQTIQELKSNGLSLHVLSGDNDNEKAYLAQVLGGEKHLHFNQKPEDKLDYIAQLQQKGKKVMMVGDGLNDSGALKQSDVGIVISENVYNFSPASDAILDASEFARLPRFISLSRFALKVLKASFGFSFLYNSIGFGFAALNLLTPLIAAVLMPLSSITVVFLTTFLIRSKKLR